ncbi:hypothetical protein K458DRAFT_170233 [Lentithecium fluviatile CBS 122367]|uniref:Uncharacterized protein n=1 Tax=Lentithecium fluviatile CBS 122367 TaxID=1168545 RepID=A0A6G1JB77_9PLEO|nr:hypothetical protein K458DRAFT_170233 [Lentithecium fluviatile CBS 122367]
MALLSPYHPHLHPHQHRSTWSSGSEVGLTARLPTLFRTAHPPPTSSFHPLSVYYHAHTGPLPRPHHSTTLSHPISATTTIVYMSDTEATNGKTATAWSDKERVSSSVPAYSTQSLTFVTAGLPLRPHGADRR